MVKMIPSLLWIVLALSSIGCSGCANIDVGRVLTGGRDGWQHPERVVEALAISPGDHVAEVGAGAGYWLPELSAAVGPTGRVYAVEVEAELASDLEAFVEKRALDNVEVVLGDYDDPKLPDHRIDLVMTSLTYHHIEDRVAYFERLERNLAPGGRIAHLDDRPDSPAPISWFQSSGHWSDPAAIDAEMQAAGYSRVASYDFLPAQSFQIFVPQSDVNLHTKVETETSALRPFGEDH